MPLIRIHWHTRARASPSHPMCSSHSMRIQMNDLGDPAGTVEPGTKTRAMMATTTTGAAMAARNSDMVLTVSCSSNGNLSTPGVGVGPSGQKLALVYRPPPAEREQWD